MANEPVVKDFNKVLFSMRDSKVAISKQKIVEITKAAMNGIRYFKHIVLCVEKFIQKCDQPFKLPSFYVLDSIVRQGIKQYKEKDVFGPRFAVNLLKTLENALNCSDEDKLKIVRVINLWRTHNVFDSNVVESLLRYCQSVGLDVDIKTVEMKVKGDRADLTIYTKDVKKSRKATPKTPPLRDDFNESFASRTSQTSNLSDVPPINGLSEKEINTRLQHSFPQWAPLIEKEFNKLVDLFNTSLKERVDREKASQGANISSILTQDFDYSDDEDEQKQKNEFKLSKEKIDSFANEVFSDSNFISKIANLYSEFTSAANTQMPPTLLAFPQVTNVFPPGNPWFDARQRIQFPNPFPTQMDQTNFLPMPIAPPDNGRTDSSSRKHGKKRERERSPDRKRRHRSRSRSRSPADSDKDREKERKRLGLPSRLRDEHTIIASRTLWFGRLPQNCTEQNIKDAVKDSGSSPEKINIIGSRACAYVTMAQRRAAYKLIDRLHRDIRVNGKSIKLEWATGAGINKSDQIMDFWDSSRGYFEIPHKKLPKDFAKFLDGNHLVVESLPSELKGKYTESGPVQDSDHHGDKNESVQMMDIPLPNLDQLPPPIAGFQPTMGNDNGGVLPGLPSLAFPGFIQPNLLAAVLAQQQTQPGFDNLFTALQQNSGAGILPTPSGQPPNMFLEKQQGMIDPNQQQFQPKFNNQRGFRPRFGNNNYRPRFNNNRGSNDFRLRGRGRGDFRPRGRGRGNFQNANFQPLPQFVPNNGEMDSNFDSLESDSVMEMQIDNENSL